MIDPITLLRAAEHGLPAAESHPDPPYVCFPMPSEWRAMQPVAVESYPAPLVDSRSGAVPDAIPGPFQALQVHAEAHGWRTLAQYAHGWVPHATTGRPGAEPRESWALRLARGELGACAVYLKGTTSWTWDSLFVWSPVRPYCRIKSVAGFKAELAWSSAERWGQ